MSSNTKSMTPIEVQKILEENEKLKKQVYGKLPNRDPSESRVNAARNRLSGDLNVANKRTAIGKIVAETTEDIKKYPENHFRKTPKSPWNGEKPRACLNYNSKKCDQKFMHKIQPQNYNSVFHYCCVCMDILGSIEYHPASDCTLLKYMDEHPPESLTMMTSELTEYATHVLCTFCNQYYHINSINTHIDEAHPAQPPMN